MNLNIEIPDDLGAAVKEQARPRAFHPTAT
jgi:hypothetical protein